MIVTRAEHGRSVFAEVDPVVKAHQESVSVSRIFVSIYPHVVFNMEITVSR